MPRRQLDNRASVTLALGLESARKAANLSPIDLANKIRSTPQHVRRIEDRRANPAQALIAALANGLGKSPADLYLIGEMRLDERTLELARRRRRRIEQERDLESILSVLGRLDDGDLRTVAAAVFELSKNSV